MTHPIKTAAAFIQNCQNQPQGDDLDQLFYQKLDISKDRSELIQTGLTNRAGLNQYNLSRLYEDLFRISRWRAEVPFPQNYLADRTWMELNKMELDIRSQIRAELNHTAKDLQFMEKDLRESLLEYKIAHQKSRLFNLEDVAQGIESGGMAPEAAYPETTGDLYPRCKNPPDPHPMANAHRD